MSNSSIALPVVLGLVMLGLGIGSSAIWLRQKYQQPLDTLAQDKAALQQRIEHLDLELRDLENEKAALQGTQAKLVARLEEAERKATAPAPAPAVAASSQSAGAAKAGALKLAFGPYAELSELANADWKKLAGSSKVLQSTIDELIATIKEGGEPSEELQLRIATANTDLQGFALSLYNKLPTDIHGNGEYTHPLLLGNLVATVLEGQELPLSEQQQQELVRLGSSYEGEWQATNDQYGTGTCQLQKVLDEIEMKQRFMSGLEETLDATQRGAVFSESLRDCNRLDVYSPSLMLAASSRPIEIHSLESLEGELQKHAKDVFGLNDAELAASAAVFQAWGRELGGDLAAVTAPEVPFFRLHDAVRAGRAQQRAVEALLRSSGLSEEARQKILRSGLLIVPRLVTQ